MKKDLYIIILSFIAIAVYADNRQGIDFYKAGEPTIASRLFEKQLNSSPAEQAEALYYLGEIAFDELPKLWLITRKDGRHFLIMPIIK